MTGQTAKSVVVEIGGADDFLPARALVRDMATECGFTVLDRTKLVTAASEILWNMIRFCGGGRMQVEIIDSDARRAIKLTLTDDGPGIEDVDLAMQDGYSTRDSFGVGLPGAKRLVKEFTITSAPGKGTRIELTHYA